jgi:putative FmdB family regulatory protein
MPIFEFLCTDCGKPFEELLRSSFSIEDVDCPHCGSGEVKKKISMFASKVAGGASFSGFSPSASSSCSTGT